MGYVSHRQLGGGHRLRGGHPLGGQNRGDHPASQERFHTYSGP